MPRCWVIAPVEAKPPELFDRVWRFDVANNLISIGWSQLGDVSKMSREKLSDAVKNPATTHPNFLEVGWDEQPRDKVFPTLVFPMHTLTEISDVRYRDLVEGSVIQVEGTVIPDSSDISVPTEAIDQTAFVLEKYLEDFIVTNFDTIFKGKLQMYEDAAGADGQQYATDIGPIDILATELKSGSFMVIELKKGRPSDQVIGQILRYMGWFKRNLCKDGQGVKGLVICRDPDPKLSYALEMTNNIDVRYYSVRFELKEAP